MDKSRRKSIRAVINTLENVVSEIDFIKDEEDCARDGIPENLQNSERYEHSEFCSDNMQEANDCIQEAISRLEEIT